MKTTIKHSETKQSWKIVGTQPGGIYNYARVDYIISGNDEFDTREKYEALQRASVIRDAFNKEN